MPVEKYVALLSTLLKSSGSCSISVAERPWHLLGQFKAAGFLVNQEPLSPCSSPQHALSHREVHQPGRGPCEAPGTPTPSPIAPSHSLSNLLFMLRRRRCTPASPHSALPSHQGNLSGSVRSASTKTSQEGRQQVKKPLPPPPQQQHHLRPRQRYEKRAAREQPHCVTLPHSQQHQPSHEQPSRQRSPAQRHSLADGGQHAFNRQGPEWTDENPKLLLQGVERALGSLQWTASSATSPSFRLDPSHLGMVERAMHTLADWDLEVCWSPKDNEQIKHGKGARLCALKKGPLAAMPVRLELSQTLLMPHTPAIKGLLVFDPFKKQENRNT
eukprot:1160468-Pelagomonas_calceolata.AAC.15